MTNVIAPDIKQFFIPTTQRKQSKQISSDTFYKPLKRSNIEQHHLIKICTSYFAQLGKTQVLALENQNTHYFLTDMNNLEGGKFHLESEFFARR